MRFNADFLSEKELDCLHAAIVKALTEIGVRFQHEEALNIFRENGASVTGDTVRIPESLLNRALQSVPDRFSLKGRTPEYDLEVGGGKPVLTASSGPVFARVGGVRRLATQEDFLNLLKLTETSPLVNMCNYIVVEPQDMPEERRKLYQVASALKYSHKPLIGITMGKGRTEECLSLLDRFYQDSGSGTHRAIGIISPISPLMYDEGMTTHIMGYARKNQPIMIAACSQPGATSPATLAGTLVIDAAEVLAGVTLSQLVKPGLPVIMGSTSAACDLRYVSPAIGSPETGLLTVAFKALCKRYNIPCRSGGALSDSKDTDMQAGIEGAMTMLPAILSGVDFILHACGTMDSFNTVCLEKFIIDEEICSAMLRMAAGFEINDDTLALDCISEVMSGEDFMTHDHTLDYFKTEMWRPALFSRENFSKWENAGAKILPERAAEMMRDRLSAFKFPQLTQEQEKLLEPYLKV
jgi:trimethylamine--corrinoid protein Co-methyltransferase